jgi:hypothetical protein
MDERNERLVFDRIVQSCCSDKSKLVAAKPQYFLVSPKLLQGLRAMEHDDVTVLLVWNGPGVKSKWQLFEVIKTMRRLAAGAGAVEDEEDDEEEEEEGANRGKENLLLLSPEAAASSSSGSSGRGKRGAGAGAGAAGSTKKKQKV